MEAPTFKQRLQSIGKFLWDSENGKVLGRGGRSWAEIGLFYLVYYACLAAFFAATMAVFYQTIDSDEPRLLSDSSLLKGHPGMGIRPRTDESNYIVAKAKGKNGDFMKSVTEFLKPYEKDGLENTDCSALTEPRQGEKVACKVDMTALMKDKCTEANDFGMSDSKPCILLKMNKVFGWIPDLWDSSDDAPSAVQDIYNPAFIPVKCYAKEDKHEDALGTVEYYPQQGFPVYYHPYMKQKDYRSPLVFAQFSNMTQGKKIEIECRTYAKNIRFDVLESTGGVKFDLKIAEEE